MLVWVVLRGWLPLTAWEWVREDLRVSVARWKPLVPVVEMQHTATTAAAAAVAAAATGIFFSRKHWKLSA